MTTADQEENPKVSEADLTPAKKISDLTHRPQIHLSKSENPIGIARWYAQMNFMYIYNLNYSYRAKTESIF